MPKAKGANKRKKFNYNANRKKLKTKAKKQAKPRIECKQLRSAWNYRKSASQNLADMGLAFDPNKSLPCHNRKVTRMEVDCSDTSRKTKASKLYVLKKLEAEASLPEKKTNALSTDMKEYVRHMIEHHGENYKEMAKNEKNYYQDTPNQIRRKVDLYKRYHPEEYEAFMTSLKEKKMDTS
ncbi:NOP16 protein, partial [Polypterus senegalus]|nr:nucleolar protein 16 [Polypterus senegalus]MBN3290590.1 NOP16 protein [Polypterus senegalus]